MQKRVKRTSKKSIVSMIFGIVFIVIILPNLLLSLLFLPIGLLIMVFSVSGIVLGVIAIKEISKDNSLKGRGFAITGIILNSLAIVLQILVIILGLYIITSQDFMYNLEHRDHFRIGGPFEGGGVNADVVEIEIGLKNNITNNIKILSVEIDDCGIYSTNFDIKPGELKRIKVRCDSYLEYHSWNQKDVIVSYSTQESSDIQKAKGRVLYMVRGVLEKGDDLTVAKKDEFMASLNEKIVALKEKAVAEGNVEFCGEIVEVFEKEVQKFSLESSELNLTKDQKYHVLLEPSIFFSDTYESCIQEVAILLKKEELCIKEDASYALIGELHSSFHKNSSLDEINLFFGNRTESSPWIGQHYMCIEKVVVKNYDEECSLIENYDLKKSCVIEAAKKNKDPLTCAKIKVLFGKYSSQCSYDLALDNKNETMCEYIRHQTIYDYCKQDVQKTITNPDSCEIEEDTVYYITRRCV